MKDSGFGRLIGVLVAPGETFRSIAERPTWVAPLLVLLALGVGLQWAMQQRVDPEQFVRDQAETFGAELTDEQVEQQVESATNPRTRALTMLGGVAGGAAFYAFCAFLFWVAFRMFGSEIAYAATLSTLLYGMVPLGIASLLNIPLALARETITFEDTMAGGVLMSNLGFLAGEETGAVARALLQSADFFSVWVVVLLVIGYRATARVSTATSTGVVLTLWLLGVALKAGMMGLASMFTNGGGS